MNKPHNRAVMHSTVAQPVPEQWSAPPSQLPPVHVLDTTLDGEECPFGQLGSAVLALLPHSSSLAQHEAQESPGFGVSTA